MSPKTMITGPQSHLSEAERALVDAYNKIVEVLDQAGDELEPFEQRNALKAAAALWQVMNGLDLDPGQLYDVGA